ncbi:hypothetical protein AAZX31_13G009600 [Glycine max]|nr:hypothetical protein GYH30_034906 [Glycine max]
MKYGKVWQVYIARKRDKWGNHYGFVRYLEVGDVKSLKTKLDEIKIENVKMNANVPHFENNSNIGVRRGVMTKNGRAQSDMKPKGPQLGTYRVAREQTYNVPNNKGKGVVDTLYANVVRCPPTDVGQKWRVHKRKENIDNHIKEWTTKMKVDGETKGWLVDRWARRLKDLTLFERLNDIYLSEEGDRVKLRYLNSDAILSLVPPKRC